MKMLLFTALLSISVNLIVVHCYSFANRSTMEVPSSRPTFAKYQEMRQQILSQHLDRALGADVVLNEREQQLNSIVMELKADELSRGFQNPFNFTPSRHFFDVMKSVESSPLFKLIRKMPKGML